VLLVGKTTLRRESGQGVSRKKAKESLAPVVEDDDGDEVREGKRQCLKGGGGVESDCLRRGLDMDIRDAGQDGSSPSR
jgi:hypothetical protein